MEAKPSLRTSATKNLSCRFCGRRIWKDSDVSGRHAIAVGVFDEVHSFVRKMQQAFLCARVHRVRSHPEAGGQADFQTFLLKPHAFANEFVQAPRNVQRVVFGGLWQKENEFVSTVAERKIDQTAVRLQSVSDFSQQPRTHQVSV